MAVFLINICKFNGCGITFPSLGDLIQHIEDTHIDYDSQILGQKEKSQSTCLPLSYVLRYITDPIRKENSLTNGSAGGGGSVASGITSSGLKVTLSGAGTGTTGSDGTGYQSTPPGTPGSTTSSLHGGSGGGLGSTAGTGLSSVGGGTGSESKISTTGSTGTDIKRKNAIKHHSYSMSSSNRSTTPTGSEMDDDDMMVSESEDSNDSWTTEEFSSEFIMRYGSRRHSSSGGNGLNSSNEKPFACPVPGCKKRYKNVNGIKYHSKNGHKKDGNRVRKGFKCHCGKSYKTSQRLKNHQLTVHHNSSSHDGPSLQSPGGGGGSASLVQQSSSTLSSASSSCSSSVSSIVASVCSSVNNNSTNSSSSSNSSNSSSNTGATLSVAGTVVTPAASASSQIASASNSSSSSQAGSPNSKYDNLGILTPATSPKLTLVGTGAASQDSLLPMTPISPGAGPTGGGSGGGAAGGTVVSSKSVSTAALVAQLHTEET